MGTNFYAKNNNEHMKINISLKTFLQNSLLCTFPLIFFNLSSLFYDPYDGATHNEILWFFHQHRRQLHYQISVT